MRKKKTLLICQFPGCGEEYEALRNDSKYCRGKGKRHRTAAWRLRIAEKENPASLVVFGKKDSTAIRNIKKNLFECLFMLQEYGKIGKIPVGSLKELQRKLDATIQTCASRDDRGGAIYDHVIWIWEKVLPFLEQKIKINDYLKEQFWNFRLPSEIVYGIEKLLAPAKTSGEKY